MYDSITYVIRMLRSLIRIMDGGQELYYVNLQYSFAVPFFISLSSQITVENRKRHVEEDFQGLQVRQS